MITTSTKLIKSGLRNCECFKKRDDQLIQKRLKVLFMALPRAFSSADNADSVNLPKRKSLRPLLKAVFPLDAIFSTPQRTSGQRFRVSAPVRPIYGMEPLITRSVASMSSWKALLAKARKCADFGERLRPVTQCLLVPLSPPLFFLCFFQDCTGGCGVV